MIAKQEGTINLGLAGKAKKLGHPMGGKTSTGMLERSWLHGGGESLMGPGITEAQLLKAMQGREKHPGIFPPPVCQSSITAFHWLNLPDGSWES